MNFILFYFILFLFSLSAGFSAETCDIGGFTTGLCVSCPGTDDTFVKCPDVCEILSWSPLPSSTCSGVGFTQTSNCGTVQSSVGTKSCPSVCSDTYWSPSKINTCSGVGFTQTSNCGNTKSSIGTKSCPTTPTSTPDVIPTPILVAAPPVVAAPVDGVCGSASGVNSYIRPEHGLCNVGAPSYDSPLRNKWSWMCEGLNGGSSSICIANKKIDGVCDLLTMNSCQNSGILSDKDDTDSEFKWSCLGLNGGNNPVCSIPVIYPTSFQVEPSSVYYDTEFVKQGTCRYDSSIGKLIVHFQLDKNIFSPKFKLAINGDVTSTSKDNIGTGFYSFRYDLTEKSLVSIVTDSTSQEVKLLECYVEKTKEFNEDIDLFESEISGKKFLRTNRLTNRNFFEIDKFGDLFYRDTQTYNSQVSDVEDDSYDIALNLHKIYKFNDYSDGVDALRKAEKLKNDHDLNIKSNTVMKNNCYQGIYSKYDYSDDSAFIRKDDSLVDRSYINKLKFKDLSLCENSNDEKLRTNVIIELKNITKGLVVYQILPKYLVDDVSGINFINDGGAQRFIKDKDPIIGWYFNDTIDDGVIVMDLPGNGTGGTFILAEEPILYNDGEIIVNYRVSSCNLDEINLFDLLSLDGSKIYAPGTSFYKVCVTHLSEELKSGFGINSAHIGNYIVGENYSFDSSVFGNGVDINVDRTDIYWSIIISDTNPDGSFSCLGSVDNLLSSLFGDCLYNEDNKIWLHLGEDLYAPATNLTTSYISHTVPVTLESIDNLDGSGVDRIYYCIDLTGTCDPLIDGSVVYSNVVKFTLSCPDLIGCIKFVSYLSVDVAGNFEDIKVTSVKMIDAGSSCQSDCTVKPNPGRHLYECNQLNSCQYYEYDFNGIFDSGDYVASQCDLALGGSFVKYNSSHEIKCPSGPIKESKFADEILDLTQSACNNLNFREYPASIDGTSVILKVYVCLD